MRMKVIAPKSKALRKKRVCAYVRVSGDSEELENSMDNQIRFFEDYIRRNPDWEMAGIYCDQVSAATGSSSSGCWGTPARAGST